MFNTIYAIVMVSFFIVGVIRLFRGRFLALFIGVGMASPGIVPPLVFEARAAIHGVDGYGRYPTGATGTRYIGYVQGHGAKSVAFSPIGPRKWDGQRRFETETPAGRVTVAVSPHSAEQQNFPDCSGSVARYGLRQVHKRDREVCPGLGWHEDIYVFEHADSGGWIYCRAESGCEIVAAAGEFELRIAMRDVPLAEWRTVLAHVEAILNRSFRML